MGWAPAETLPTDTRRSTLTPPGPAYLLTSLGVPRGLLQPRCPLPASRARTRSSRARLSLLRPRGSLQTPDSCPRLLICPPMGHRSPFSPLRPAYTGCPVNRVISHAHLDSCESGPPRPPGRRPPAPPSRPLGFSRSSFVGSGVMAGLSEHPASWQGWPGLRAPLS